MPESKWSKTICTILLIITFIVIALYAWALIVMSLDWPAHQNLNVDISLLWLYWISYAALWLFLGVGVWFWARLKPQFLSLKKTFWLIFIVALIPRLIVVFATQPTLSDDIWRYIHDGDTFVAGHNPYQTAPAEITPENSPSHPEVHKRINHPHLVTIYQPISQYVFAVVSLFKVQTWDAWGDKTFRLAFVFFDLGIIYLMLSSFKQTGRSLWFATLYAWHPLPIAEIAGSGHQDVLGILPLLGAFLLYQSHKKTMPRVILTGKLFAISLAVKPIMAPFFIPMIWWLRKEKKRLLAFVLSTIKILIIIYIPFFFLQGGVQGLINTSRTFMDKWETNDSLYPYFFKLFNSNSNDTQIFIVFLLLLTIVLGLLSKENLWKIAIAFVLAALLFSSTVHPWYLLWLLALLPFCFSLPAWVFSLTISWSYVAHANPQGYIVYPSIILAEYVPVYFLVICSLTLWIKHWRYRIKHPPQPEIDWPPSCC